MSDQAISTREATRSPSARRLPVGAEYLGNGRTHVRVWAPRVSRVDVIVPGNPQVRLSPETGGYFSGEFDARPGDRYQFKLGDDDKLYPDPASRYQPEGPHGASEVVDPSAFEWHDGAWPGITLRGQIAYELHIGTFTPAGTFAAATSQLAELARLGITLIEVMPVAEFDGRFGWGYDGVDLFAPFHRYGRPDDFRTFVDTAHSLGLGVILDVVYNHLGPVGNYLRAFSPSYFSDAYENEWGDAINFDGPDSGPVREFFMANAGYWIEEFHFDGLRLDATQQIFDASPTHVLSEIGRRAREAAAPRTIVIVAENEPQDTRLVRPLDEGGYGLDALWNDDFHHSAMVALTGRSEAYYTDTRGEPQEFISAAKYGYLFQGQQYYWQRKARGTAAWGLEPSRFVAYTQNHDQVANTATGSRGHELTAPGRWRAMTALLLLGPWTPMLFQGQEFASSSPFLYFADFGGDLGAAVQSGRSEFLMQFPSVVDYVQTTPLDEPGDEHTFIRSKLDLIERETHERAYVLHRDLIALRRGDPAFSRQQAGGVDGAVLTASAFALRFFTPDHTQDRVLIVNFGSDTTRPSFAEPLLAPPPDSDWHLLWSSDAPKYGGAGTGDLWPDGCWKIPGETAVVIAPGPMKPQARQPARSRRTA